jgi:drug/metabolite transporter (DMT)-like permease
MNYDYPQTDLSRSILAGLFSGLVATVSNLAFTIIYRSITRFYEFNAIDITTIVFGTILLSLACGAIFYFFVHYLNKGIMFYRIMVFIVTAIIAYVGIDLRHLVQENIPSQFIVLVIGTQVIIGLLAAFLIPYLFRHEKVIS